MKRAIHPVPSQTTNEIVIVSFMYPTNGSRIRYPCGHDDRHALIIKVPERLYDACRAKGWLQNVNSWNCVVAFHHPSAGKCEVKEIGFKSEYCSECVIAILNAELSAIDSCTKAASSHVRAAKRPPFVS
ncbi:MAG TPA: hypothetical protein VN397_05170 [Candidatus Methylomirabilis sp.]|nr:hypothetical protein [Candidatus Methylomirabilis sp.]